MMAHQKNYSNKISNEKYRKYQYYMRINNKINLLKISETLEIQHFTLYNEIEQNKSDSS